MQVFSLTVVIELKYSGARLGPEQSRTLEEFVACINPFGVRIKPNGKARILVDPTITGVNGCMNKLPCSLTTPETFMKTLTTTDLLGKRDLTNGFYHVSLHPSARRYMGFRHPVTGKIGRWIALPQGTAQSPHFSVS